MQQSMQQSTFLFDYYRKVAGVPDEWVIVIKKEPCGENPVGLRWDNDRKQAQICFNPNWYFSENAYIHGLMHELFELTTIETWILFLKVAQFLPVEIRSTHIEQFRKARDTEIDQRCANLPWFSIHDRPLRIS